MPDTLPPQPLDHAFRSEARRFEVLRCLGAGGFGEVYLATMISPAGVRSEVAVKVLHEGLDPRSQAVQRLRDEGRMLGTLNHPAVLKVHDLVMLGERVALVMEYVPGLDLEGCFSVQPPLPVRAGLEVLARVADALHTAWKAPGPDGTPLALVHRDIKPSNIRIGHHGEVKLLDFGIAKAADARREAKTQTRMTIGSPWYMAPERFDGVSDHPASDVYALGCTLYELVAGGARLFDALSARQHFLLAMDDTAHDAHVRDHLARVQAPDAVRELLREMLAFAVEARPLAVALGPRIDDLVESLPGVTLRRWCRDTTWPEPSSDVEGVLVGQVLTEHRISGITTPDTPAPSPTRSEPTLAAGATFAVPAMLPTDLVEPPPFAPGPPAPPATPVVSVPPAPPTPPLPQAPPPFAAESSLTPSVVAAPVGPVVAVPLPPKRSNAGLRLVVLVLMGLGLLILVGWLGFATLWFVAVVAAVGTDTGI